MLNRTTFTEDTLRRAFFNGVDEYADLISEDAENPNEEAAYDAADFLSFVGDFLRDLGVLTSEEIEQSRKKLEEADSTGVL